MSSTGSQLWKGICFRPLVKKLIDVEFNDAIKDDKKKVVVIQRGKATITETHASFTAEYRPEFTITKWPSVPAIPTGMPGT